METSETKRTEPKRTEHRSASPVKSETRHDRTQAMATVSSSSDASGTAITDIFRGSEPRLVVSEKKVSPSVNSQYWNKFYTLALIASGTEEKKRKARVSVYLYCAVNGTSRVGEYSSEVITADGTAYNASIILKACDTRNVRKWMRTNADEAILFFRATHVLDKEHTLVQNAITLGFAADAVIGLVDFVGDSSLLYANEQRLNVKSFEKSIVRARGARNGDSLERVEQDAVSRNLDAQDGTSEPGHVLKM